MYADANPVDWFVKEFRYGVWDSDINKMNTEELFDIVRLAHADWKRGKRVLIRCQAGWNRSGLITALVLIREGMGAREAIDLIRKTRSEWALCNKSFEKFLLEQDPKVWQGDSYGNDTPKK
jgi:protein-tyrosine phosphatase